MTEARHYCQKCHHEIASTDVACSSCGSILSEVGRSITIVLTESMSLSSSLSLALNKTEQTTLEKVFTWLRDRVDELEFEGIEIGFPSGIKVKFTKRREHMERG